MALVQRQPGELLGLLQGLAGGDVSSDEGHLMDVLGWTQSLLASDTSASLTLLPGLLGLVSESRPGPRAVLISCLSKILRAAANFEPTTAIAVFTACLEALAFLSTDTSIQVLVAFVRCHVSLFPTLIRFLGRYVSDPRPWSYFSAHTLKIESLIHHPNDGVKIATVKFLQMQAIVQSPRDPLSTERSYPALDDIPLHHPFMKTQELRGEGVNAFNKLIAILSMTSMSASVMTAAINSLLVICQHRAEYIDFTVKTLMEWRVSPPEHLKPHQVKSVERTIKIFMLCMLRVPAAEALLQLISEYLMDIGVRSMEVRMRIQQKSSSNKRAFASDWEEDAKRFKTEQDFQLSDLFLRVVDITRIPYPLVIEIVIQTLVSVTPERWQNGVAFYQQLNGIAPVLPTPLTKLEQGDAATPIKSELEAPQTSVDGIQPPSPTTNLYQETAIPELDVDPETLVNPPRELSSFEKHQVFQEILHRFFELDYRFAGASAGASNAMTTAGTGGADRDSVAAAKSGWMLLISRLLTRQDAEAESQQIETIRQAKEALVSYILDDFRQRMDLALLWLHDEYLKQTVSVISSDNDYAFWLHKLLDGISKPRNEEGEYALDPKDRTFARFLMDVPELTTQSLAVVQEYCHSEERMPLGISTLRDMVLYRPAVRPPCLDQLLGLCLHPHKTTRATAIVTCKKFFKEHASLGPVVEAFALTALQTLLEPPPIVPEAAQAPETVVEDVKDMEIEEVANLVAAEPDAAVIGESSASDAQLVPETGEWKDTDAIRYLELYFSLCSKHHDFLDEIFKVFPQYSEAVQKIVLAHIGGLIRALSTSPAKLLSLIRSFPPDCDALILRIYLILADRKPISPELVETAKEVYRNKELDARFIIPVLSALSKEEVLLELPKITSLLDGTEKQRDVVRQVFVDLNSSKTIPGSEGNPDTFNPALIPPVELMIVLHTLEDTIGLRKAVEATSICFDLKEIYTQEVLAMVLQQLVDLAQLPILLMRTVIQSLTTYKDLSGFVNSILTRLIMKKIWTYPKLWDGFIRCCTINFPSSLPVLYTLPAAQAKTVIQKSPNLKEALQKLVESLPPVQRQRREFQKLIPLLQ